MEINNFDRRDFIKGSAATLALTSLSAKGFAKTLDTKKQYKVGLIGTGWYGKSDLFRLIQVANVDVVALCDVDTKMLSEAIDLVSKRLKTGKKPKGYGDYRQMLKENKFDIVLIGSPDHWHALQCIDAIKSGAHVFVQKPISVDVIEGEAMVAAARKYNKVVQVGTQRRSTPFLKQAKEDIVEKGLLGKISHVEICCYYGMRNGSNPDLQPIPSNLDYEMWTGPAPLRPYDGLPHRRWWRAFMEYGNGVVGDMCVHMLDAVRWTMDLGWPKRISSQGGIYIDKEAKSNISDTQSAVFEYDELNIVWQHRTWGKAADPKYPWSYKIYGDKGTLEASTTKYDFTPIKGEPIHVDVTYDRVNYPEDLTEDSIELNAAPAMRAHMLDFLAAIENNTRPVADIEQGHISTASCILANLSCELGRPLVYDPETRQVVGDAEATQLLMREYRAPYVHPHPARV
ncbi:Gfo/Idh/MocA family oxidoreductase [Arcticibacterium luteifluviistationis]|uniref:Oxidoreductase n=1 Tax=Arcticibacterium luteifluviistationis TaxID=1784714 RepID=A0A2Z4G8A5_9BACT|nr:Gfo/Idh/MocA family oxidoreductase [Arcticibacterium luteifluviistationis]AWV97376.1 oxidoreductase [Arcticibacterium luteifluviistationis]